MPMSGHGRQLCPDICCWFVAFNGIQGLEAISPSNYVQFAIQNGHSKLQPPARHSSHCVPRVCSEVVLFNACRTYSKDVKVIV